ncbi:penicillin-binding protein 2 [Candidatus Babeliales bacterium]|nr:penicillin-binding protein 2 [Candidatus Babeliales bacterium]
MIKKNYKPRVFIILIIFSILFFTILTRLYLIQIHRKDFFKILAEQQYKVELKINPPRAKIYDSIGKVALTINREVDSTFILPNQFEEPKKIRSFFKKYFKKIYKKIKRDKNKKIKFLWLERRLSKEKLEWFKNFKLNDIHFLKEPARFYPFPASSTILGFTDIDNFGLAGIEMQFNSRLSGTPTTLELKKDARSGKFYFEKKIKEKGKKGQPVFLTIDRKLQFLAYEELKKTVDKFEAKSGSVLIIDPDSGKILTMANYPDFDPNKKEIEQIENTKNRIITECYELGSVMKTFSALAALEEEVVTPEEEIDCEGKKTYIDKFKIENWKSVGVVPFTDVVRLSSNVGIAKIAKRLGPKLYTHLRRLGFGNKTNIQFPGERSGFVNPPHKWSRPSLLVLSFGYELMGTILQLGKAFCIISNDGYDVCPQLITKPKKFRSTFRKKIYKDKTIKQIKKILQTIGNNYKQNLEGFRVMGKTGTARSVKNGKYSKKHHVYFFGGIVEKGPYKRVIVTSVNEPKGAHWWASQITAPLFNQVAQRMVIHDLTQLGLSASKDF